MSIPVVPEHNNRIRHCDCSHPDYCCFKKESAKTCPACAVEENNKAWAKYLTEIGYWGQVWHEVINENRTMWCIPEADWEQIKKLAEEKVDG